jgi:hypothetical protein
MSESSKSIADSGLFCTRYVSPEESEIPRGAALRFSVKKSLTDTDTKSRQVFVQIFLKRKHDEQDEPNHDAALLLPSNFTIAVRSLCCLQGSSLTQGGDVIVQLR